MPKGTTSRERKSPSFYVAEPAKIRTATSPVTNVRGKSERTTPYGDLLKEAIIGLKSRVGSSFVAIEKYVRSKEPVGFQRHYLQAALLRALKNEKIKRHHQHLNSFVLSVKEKSIKVVAPVKNVSGRVATKTTGKAKKLGAKPAKKTSATKLTKSAPKAAISKKATASKKKTTKKVVASKKKSTTSATASASDPTPLPDAPDAPPTTVAHRHRQAPKKATASSKTTEMVLESKDSSLNQVLWQAVREGNVRKARDCLELGTSPELMCVRTGSPDEYPRNYRVIPIDDFKYDDAEGHRFDFPDGQMPWDQRSWISLLMLAAQTGSAEMIELLIEHGADKDFEQPRRISYADGYLYGGITALMCAGMSPEATRALLDAGVALKKAAPKKAAPQKVALKKGAPLKKATASSKTTKMVIEREDVDLTIEGLPGYEGIPCPNFTALLLTKNAEVAKMLVEGGADVNHAAAKNYGNGDNRLACYWLTVVASGDVAWAKELLEKYKANPNWPHNSAVADSCEGLRCEESYEGPGQTVLMVAIRNRDVAMVELLLEKGADPNRGEIVLRYGQYEELSETEKEGLATPLSVALHMVASKGSRPPVGGAVMNDDVVISPQAAADPIVKLLIGHGARAKVGHAPLPREPPSTPVIQLREEADFLAAPVEPK